MSAPSYTEVVRILQRSLGEEEGLRVMEFFMQHLPFNVATKDQVDALHVRIEQVQSKLIREIEQARAELMREIEQVRAELMREIEQVRAELMREIEQVRAELTREIAETKVTMIRWAFLFWISQMAMLAGILFKLLS